MVPNDSEKRLQALTLLTIVGVGVGEMAAGPFVPGSPFMPIVGPITAQVPAPWRDDEPTSIYVAYRNAGTFVSAVASGSVSVRPASGTLNRFRI
jgi:hypothetical protein